MGEKCPQLLQRMHARNRIPCLWVKWSFGTWNRREGRGGGGCLPATIWSRIDDGHVSAVYLLCVYYALYCALLCSVLCVLTMCPTVHFTECIPESYLTKKLDTVSRRRFAFSSPSISVWITVWLSLFCALSRVSLYVCALIREREGESANAFVGFRL